MAVIQTYEIQSITIIRTSEFKKDGEIHSGSHENTTTLHKPILRSKSLESITCVDGKIIITGNPDKIYDIEKVKASADRRCSSSEKRPGGKCSAAYSLEELKEIVSQIGKRQGGVAVKKDYVQLIVRFYTEHQEN